MTNFGADGPWARHVPTEQWLYTFDAQGCLSQALNPNGSVRVSAIFDAQGGEAISNGMPPDPYGGFGGQWGYRTDWQANYPDSLVLCGHRFYDFNSGRFLNRDSIGYDGGVNLYAYCGNNSVNRDDPEGFDAGWAGAPGEGPWGPMKSPSCGMSPRPSIDCGRANDRIRHALKAVCDKLSSIKSLNLQNCIRDMCNSAVIECVPQNDWRCQDSSMPGNAEVSLGELGKVPVTTGDYGAWGNGRIYVCQDLLGTSESCIESVLVHEMAHGCGQGEDGAVGVEKQVFPPLGGCR